MEWQILNTDSTVALGCYRQRSCGSVIENRTYTFQSPGFFPLLFTTPVICQLLLWDCWKRGKEQMPFETIWERLWHFPLHYSVFEHRDLEVKDASERQERLSWVQYCPCFEQSKSHQNQRDIAATLKQDWRHRDMKEWLWFFQRLL